MYLLSDGACAIFPLVACQPGRYDIVGFHLMKWNLADVLGYLSKSILSLRSSQEHSITTCKEKVRSIALTSSLFINNPYKDWSAIWGRYNRLKSLIAAIQMSHLGPHAMASTTPYISADRNRFHMERM